MGKIKKVIKYDGKLYESYWSLFYDLDKAGKTPCHGMCEDLEEDYPLEKYILKEVMKLDIQEEPVH